MWNVLLICTYFIWGFSLLNGVQAARGFTLYLLSEKEKEEIYILSSV